MDKIAPLLHDRTGRLERKHGLFIAVRTLHDRTGRLEITRY
ncbi:hypothetical protein E9M_07339 [Moraxella catarrhalis 46P47B1]|nr:hypothetical protein E9M_07339 [Moraxella catarrhalis 46P47B1]